MTDVELEEIKSISQNSDDNQSDSEFKIENKISYDQTQIYMLNKRFKRLHSDAAKLLHQSQQNSRVSMAIKILIIFLGLTTSYISAFSGVDDNSKTYITTMFSLSSALLSGLTSIKNFSKDSARFYEGYIAYLEKATSIEPIFYTFSGNIPFEELITGIDKIITKYEGVINKTHDEHVIHGTRRYKKIENLVFEKIKNLNNGELPSWLKVLEQKK